MKILGIETSCDETSAAVVKHKKGRLEILSNIVSSQVDLHKKYGGIVPEVASRAHMQAIIPIIEESLNKAKIKLKDIGIIAVTTGPGLIGSLLVGVNTAKTLAFITGKPLVSVNHLEGHIYANFICEMSNVKCQKSKVKFPAVVLIASGGHTTLVYMKKHLSYKILGQTKDDAAGEAFDKVAKILDIGYPGGPIIEKLAKKGNPLRFDFPRAEMEGETIRDKKGFLKKLLPNLDFSFSGLKTAVLYQVKSKKLKVKNRKYITDVAASFQRAIIDVLVQKTLWAAQRTKAKSILISGGVAANETLREKLKEEAQKNGFHFFAPPKDLCTDNAAMIAAAGYFKYSVKKFTQHPDPGRGAAMKIDPNLKLK